jgi:hypothetical protein
MTTNTHMAEIGAHSTLDEVYDKLKMPSESVSDADLDGMVAHFRREREVYDEKEVKKAAKKDAKEEAKG